MTAPATRSSRTNPRRGSVPGVRTAPAGVVTDLVEDPFTGSMIEIEQGKAAPLYPPVEWMSQAAADSAPEKIQAFPGGRVAGVVAPAGRCLLKPGADCWQVPKPANDAELAMAHTGFTETADGSLVHTAVIGGGAGHASEWAPVNVAQRHYADTSTQLARGVYRWSDVAGGMTFVGAVWPEATERDIATIQASPASIDYRWIQDEGDYRLVGACLVNIGGLPSRWKMAARRVASAMILTPVMADAAPSTGTMIALKIDAPELAVDGGTDPSQMHVTLGFFGDSQVYGPEVRTAATAMVGEMVAQAGRPLLLEVSAVAVMGSDLMDPQTCFVVQADGLCELRDALMAAAERSGLVADTKFPIWIPHINLGSSEVVPFDQAVSLRGITINPPSVVLGFGSDDWREFPLPLVGLPVMAGSADAVSSSDGVTAASVVPDPEGVQMAQCDTCQAVTAAGPMAPGAPPATPQAPAGDLEKRVADLESQVAELSQMVMQGAIAAAAVPMTIPALVAV